MKQPIIYFLIIALLPSLAFGQVMFEDNTDEFTGEDNSSVQMIGTSDEFIVAWKCFSNGLNVIIGHGYLGGNRDDEVIVQTKFDDNPPSDRMYYPLSSNNRVTFFYKDDVETFTKESIASDKVMIRIIDPLDSDVMTSSFDTHYLQDALSKLPCYP